MSRILMTCGAALALAGVAATSVASAAQADSAPTTATAAKPLFTSRATTKPTPPHTTPSTTHPSTRAAAQSNTAAKKARHGDPCSAAAVACVSLSKQEAWFVRNGRIVRGPVRVATGRAGYGTERGTFAVYRKNLMWYSTIYGNAPMPYSVFFDGGEAFHEGSVYVRSHGCVHLSPNDAAWVYNFLHIGDEVQVVY